MVMLEEGIEKVELYDSSGNPDAGCINDGCDLRYDCVFYLNRYPGGFFSKMFCGEYDRYEGVCNLFEKVTIEDGSEREK